MRKLPRPCTASNTGALAPAPALALALGLALALALTLALCAGTNAGTYLFPPCHRLSLVLGLAARGEAKPRTKESLMEKQNVYDRARGVVRELSPLVHIIREHDKSLADQLKRAAQSVVLNIAEGRGNDAGNARARFSTACGSAKEVRAALNVASDWGYIEARKAAHLDGRLDQVCAITWCLSRRL
jgi:four helix bundle protein